MADSCPKLLDRRRNGENLWRRAWNQLDTSTQELAGARCISV